LQDSADEQRVPETAIAALNACDANVFHIIFILLKILATLPVSREPEQMFSKVERTPTAIRSTMTQDRLKALVLLQAHRDELPLTEDVLDKFSAANSRRLKLVL